MGQLIERIAKAPTGVKLEVVMGALAAITLVNLFVMGVNLGPSIRDIEERIVKTDATLRKLNGEYIEKQSIANDLNRFRRERELLERRLNEALAELPDDKRVDELLQLFQDRAQKAGLEIATIEPKPPVTSGFYAKIPINMKLEGSYHEIATFFDALGRLRRIVNVSDIVFDTPRDVNGKLVVKASFIATAFMFLDPKAAAAAAAASKGKPK